MTESATRREQQRLETERRITVCAQRLTDEHGLDGFTMDDLADAADVSRRTLFNYFPSKVDAVLGNPPEIAAARSSATFVAGGPHGDLVDDLGELAAALLDSKGLDREEMERGRRVVLTTPRLIWRAHERFEHITGEFVDLILAREGERVRRGRARLLIRLLVALFDGCLLGRRSPTRTLTAPRRGVPTSSSRTPATSSPDPSPSTSHLPQTTREHTMATLLYRLGKTAFRRWPLFLAGWLVAMVAVGTVAATLVQADDRRVLDPGHPVGEGRRPPGRALPRRRSTPSTRPPSTSSSPRPRATRSTSRRTPRRSTPWSPTSQALPQMPAEAPLANPVDAGPAAGRRDRRGRRGERHFGRARPKPTPHALSPLSEDGRVGIITFDFDVDTVADVEPASHDALDGRHGRGPRRRPDRRGQRLGHERASIEPGGASELIGIGVALLVLILTFGSLVAAGLPILTAIFGVGLGITGITAMTAFMDIGSSTPILATMIGLAVGIDYALFILARYRSELQHTDDREEAVGIAVGTAGSAVVFAGLTVLIALSALARRRHPVPHRDGPRGRRDRADRRAGRAHPAARHPRPVQVQGVRRPGPPLPPEARRATARSSTTACAGRALSAARPVAVVLVVVVGLGALAHPAARTCTSPSRATAPRPTDTTQRKASDLIADAFGPGREARCSWSSTVATSPRPTRGGRVRRGRRLGRRPGRRRQRPGRRHQNEARHRRPDPGHARRPAPTTPRTEDLLDDAARRPGRHRGRRPARPSASPA